MVWCVDTVVYGTSHLYIYWARSKAAAALVVLDNDEKKCYSLSFAILGIQGGNTSETDRQTEENKSSCVQYRTFGLSLI